MPLNNKEAAFVIKNTMGVGFEPTRAEHNGLAVHRLNHSAIPPHIKHLQTYIAIDLSTTHRSHRYSTVQLSNYFVSGGR